MKKRILGLLLALCLVVGLLPSVALASTKTSLRVNINYSGWNTTVDVAPGTTQYFSTWKPEGQDLWYMGGTDASNWQMKVEYPADGDPVVTFKDATFTAERAPAFYAPDGSAFNGNITFVLEGENYISQTRHYESLFVSNVSGTTTFTGNGKLTLVHASSILSGGLITTTGDLVLDGANIDIQVKTTYQFVTNGVKVGGDMTIKGGSLNVTAINSNMGEYGFYFSPVDAALNVAGKLTIQDNADVTLIGTSAHARGDFTNVGDNDLIKVGNGIFVENSTLEIAQVYNTQQNIFNPAALPAITATYTDGYTVSTSASKGTYDEATGTFTAPAATKSADIAGVTLTGLNYFKIAPAKPTLRVNINYNGWNTTVDIEAGNTQYFSTWKPEGQDLWYMGGTDASAWNMKVEYPADGDPIVTFKNATFSAETAPSFYTPGGAFKGNITFVIEGENYLTRTNIYDNLFASNVTGTTTFTGTGKLKLSHSPAVRTGALMNIAGDLVLKDLELEIEVPAVASRDTNGLFVAGDMTVNGAKLKIVGVNPYYVGYEGVYWPAYRPINYALKTGGDLIVTNGADVQFIGSSTNDAAASLIEIGGGDIRVTESTVEFAQVSGTYLNVFNAGNLPNITANYENGYIVSTTGTMGAYDLTNGTFTAPKADQTNDIASVSLSGLNYFKLAPKPASADFDLTQVVLGNDLTINFRADKAAVTAAGGTQVKAQIGNAEPVFIPLTEAMIEGDYYVVPFTGVAAKQMGQTVTMIICDAEGNPVGAAKSDSIAAYALRMLENQPEGMSAEKYAALKTVIVDMLNYGAMAQVMFAYDAENLVNAALTPEQAALGTQEMASCEKKAANADAAGYLGTSFVLNNDIAMAMALDSAIIGKNATAKVTFTNYLGQVQEEITLTADETSTDNTTVFIYNGLVAADGRCEVTWKFYDGETLKLTVTDSMEAYMGRMIEEYPELASLMKYSDSAKTYFTMN